jgi:hypothetical protein
VSSGDWRAVYREERRRPVYVIENGRSPILLNERPSNKQEAAPPLRDKKDIVNSDRRKRWIR